MIRFVILRKRLLKYADVRSDSIITLDLDVPDLERLLTSGGFDVDSYDLCELSGVEVLEGKAKE